MRDPRAGTAVAVTGWLPATGRSAGLTLTARVVQFCYHATVVPLPPAARINGRFSELVGNFHGCLEPHVNTVMRCEQGLGG